MIKCLVVFLEPQLSQLIIAVESTYLDPKTLKPQIGLEFNLCHWVRH